MLSLPFPVVDVPNSINPFVALLDDPLIFRYFKVFDSAELLNRIVAVPALFDVLVLTILKLFVAPIWFTRPSRVTLSAPFKLINGAAAIAPETYKPVLVGYIFKLVHAPWLSVAVVSSVVLPISVTTTSLPV